MTVPKTAMNENDCPVSRKDHIRATGEIALMYAKAVSERVRGAPNQKLRLRVSTPNAGHASSPLFWEEVVHHGTRFYPSELAVRRDL